MDASEFLNFARTLDSSIEAGSRSSVSRSYYCAYHVTKSYIKEVLNIDIDKIKGGSHERIVEILINDKNGMKKALGYKMRTLHARRVLADYNLDESCTIVSANEAINECEKIIKQIEKLK